MVDQATVAISEVNRGAGQITVGYSNNRRKCASVSNRQAPTVRAGAMFKVPFEAVSWHRPGSLSFGRFQAYADRARMGLQPFDFRQAHNIASLLFKRIGRVVDHTRIL